MFNKILVPLDGSDLAERALAPAFALARSVHSAVTLLRVATPEHMLVLSGAGYGVLWPDESIERSRNEGKQYLETIQKVRAQPEFIVHTAVADGDVAGAIVDSATDDDVDLIAMSTHGHSGITRWILGSVTERVLGHAPCPVLVVRSETPIRKVLIPLDGSTLAELALEPALELATRLGAEAILLRVLEPLDVQEIEYYEHFEQGLGLRMQREFRENAENYLRDMASTYRRPNLSIQTVLEEGLAAERILKFAETRGIDLIAMATHGRSGLRRWMYGSVTEKVMHDGCCSMLIVRPAMHHLN
jgi:nucleotide-binding universal stress UspA family protein